MCIKSDGFKLITSMDFTFPKWKTVFLWVGEGWDWEKHLLLELMNPALYTLKPALDQYTTSQKIR